MSEKTDKNTYICECLKISTLEMEQAIKQNNLNSLDEVSNFFKTKWACGDCFDNIEATIEEYEKIN